MSIEYSPPNPEFARRVRKLFDEMGFMQHLGVRLSIVEPGLVEQRLFYKDGLSQQQDYFHGGVVATLADNAMGCASATMLPVGADILTAEFKLNLLRPARGGELVARGTLVKPGRQFLVSRAEVFVISETGEKLCAVGLGTFAVIAPE